MANATKSYLSELVPALRGTTPEENRLALSSAIFSRPGMDSSIYGVLMIPSDALGKSLRDALAKNLVEANGGRTPMLADVLLNGPAKVSSAMALEVLHRGISGSVFDILIGGAPKQMSTLADMIEGRQKFPFTLAAAKGIRIREIDRIALDFIYGKEARASFRAIGSRNVDSVIGHLLDTFAVTDSGVNLGIAKHSLARLLNEGLLSRTQHETFGIVLGISEETRSLDGVAKEALR